MPNASQTLFSNPWILVLWLSKCSIPLHVASRLAFSLIRPMRSFYCTLLLYGHASRDRNLSCGFPQKSRTELEQIIRKARREKEQARTSLGDTDPVGVGAILKPIGTRDEWYNEMPEPTRRLHRLRTAFAPVRTTGLPLWCVVSFGPGALPRVCADRCANVEPEASLNMKRSLAVVGRSPPLRWSSSSKSLFGREPDHKADKE